ncbi:PLP-dependent transferase [Rubrivivax gelatinosus]|uniref:PLP-dependent transferase n=1 Tax=Rubrivivax gelatinosus TaxID=28068 RepID=UPI00031C0FC6|nr:PLP-dependent transferase [Rubrivivax gelatinosus]MBG6078346.1 cystathionine beta-lyase [Rubrivivax gelatinosus]
MTTKLIHHPYRPPAGFDAPQVGVHKASTVLFPDVAAMRARDWRHRSGYTYGLHGTPTTFTLEERIATLEGGTHCVLVPSGLAAIALVNMALLKAGDELLLPDNVYGPSRELARRELAAWGITHKLYDPMDPASLAAAIGPATKLVWLEAPGSVTMEFPDLPALVAVCSERGVTTALDNTWGAGLAFCGFDLGIDVVMQALTKYPSGGGDVLMGSVVTRDADLADRIHMTHGRLGQGVGANDAEAMLRSLPSLSLRYHAADVAGRELAAWCATRPEFRRVLHPALPGAPGHEHWKSTCRAAAGLFSVVVDPRFSGAQVDRFVDALQLFGIGFSWAGPMSLVVPYDMKQMRARPAYDGTVVRFSIGLEEVADLKADLEQALAALAG